MSSAMVVTRTALFVCLQTVLRLASCRNVTLPAGPLHRVAGFPLSLPCVVSDYDGPRTQDFEWFLYRDDSGGRQMGVISTRDKGFPYTPFQARVRGGEVRVDRDAGDRARLVIQRLRADDQGKYECHTPSTDATYRGLYSATVDVRVIPDTLQISFARSLTGQPLPEGAELALTCSASIQSEQITHVSVTFGRRDGAAEASGVREIITVDKQLAVVPGQLYKKRYDDGEVTLEKRNGDGGQGIYVMKMRGVQPDDSGLYFCEASQWIQDPDRSWQKIAQRKLDLGNLTVRQLAESLVVASSPRGEVTQQIGSPLLLTCEVQGLPSGVTSGLLVQWMKRAGGGGGVEVEVARMTPGGVVSWGDDLSRSSGGSMEKTEEAKFSLKLFSSRPSDSGVYRCVVSVYAGRRLPGPAAAATLTQASEGITVNLKTKDVRVSAAARLPRGPLLKTGSTVSLLCDAAVTTTGPARTQVQWLRRPLPEPVLRAPQDRTASTEGPPTLLAAILHDGVVRIYANGSEISVERLSAATYRLRIHAAVEEDQGLYACRAEVWGQDPHGGWYGTGTANESNPVTVYLYARAADLLLIPLVVGVASALLVGGVIISTVTCCFMRRLARQRARK